MVAQLTRTTGSTYPAPGVSWATFPFFLKFFCDLTILAIGPTIMLYILSQHFKVLFLTFSSRIQHIENSSSYPVFPTFHIF